MLKSQGFETAQAPIKNALGPSSPKYLVKRLAPKEKPIAYMSEFGLVL